MPLTSNRLLYPTCRDRAVSLHIGPHPLLKGEIECLAGADGDADQLGDSRLIIVVGFQMELERFR